MKTTLLAAGILLVMTLIASAQRSWEVQRTVSEFSDEVSLHTMAHGEDAVLTIVITGGCGGMMPLVGITPAPTELLASGEIHIQWDDGPIERETWVMLSSSLLMLIDNQQVEAFFEKLTRHRRLRIRGQRATIRPISRIVMDSFVLDDGTTEAVRQLQCREED